MSNAPIDHSRFFNMSLDMLCIAGTDGYFKVINPQFCSVLGYSEDELLSRQFVEFVHPDDRDKTDAEVVKLQQGHPTIRFDNRYLRADGSYCWLSWRCAPAEDGLLYAVARDITERRQLLQTEQQNHARARRFARVLRELHSLLTSDYGHIDDLVDDYLRTGLKLFGMQTAIASRIAGDQYHVEAVVTPIEGLAAGAVFPLGDTYCATVVAQGATVAWPQIGSLEAMRSHPVYENLGLESYISAPIFVRGQLYGTLNFSSTTARTADFADDDIEVIELMAESVGRFLDQHQLEQERHRATVEKEALLEQQTETARTLAELLTSHVAADTLSDALQSTLRLVVHGGWAFAGAAYTWHGPSSKYRLAATWRAAPTDDATFSLGEGPVGQAAELATPTYHQAGTDLGIFSDAFGEESAQTTAFVPLVHLSEVPAVLVLPMRSTVDEQQAAFFSQLSLQLGIAQNSLIQLRDLQDTTAQLARSAREISTKNKELERANQLKSQFLANMSHELRTPLNAIIGFSELLHDGVLGPLSAQQTEHVGDIFDAGNHLLELINDILDLSKIEAGRLQLDLDHVDVSAIVRSSAAIVRDKSTAKHLQLTVQPLNREVVIAVDRRKLKQILFNLLSNAVKFTPEGGKIWLRLRADHPEVIHIEVEDTGIGISRDDQLRLFQPFTQVDGSLSRRHEGTGLGLSLVRRLARLHGGDVEVASELGQGSMFTLTLPRAHTDPTAEPSSEDAKP